MKVYAVVDVTSNAGYMYVIEIYDSEEVAVRRAREITRMSHDISNQYCFVQEYELNETGKLPTFYSKEYIAENDKEGIPEISVQRVEE